MTHPTTDLYLEGARSLRRRRPTLVVGLSVVVAGLLVAAGAATISLTANSNTPEQAVTGLLTSAGHGDLLGALSHIDPAERDAIQAPLVHMVGDLSRIGVLAGTVDLHRVGGISADFSPLTFTTTAMRADLDTVRSTHGAVTVHLDPTQVPLAPLLHGLVSAMPIKASDHTLTVSPQHPLSFATVLRGGQWYVSIGYTVALDATKGAAGRDAGAATSPVPAKGADSATHAVDALIRAAATGDVARMIQLTPPDEMAALHEFGGALVGAMRSPMTGAMITDLQLSAKPQDDGTLVTITRVAVRGGRGSMSASYSSADGCIRLTGPPTPAGAPGCETIAGAVLAPLLGSHSGGSLPGAAGALAGFHPDLGLVAVEEGGHWFVSPIRTVMDDLAALVHALPTDALALLAPVLAGGHGAAHVAVPGAPRGAAPAQPSTALPGG